MSPVNTPIKLAGLGRRIGGQMIDSIVALLLFMLTLKAFELVSLTQHIAAFAAVAVGGGYYLLSDALPNGQSIGKKLLKMAVVSDFSYINCTIFQSVVRNITTPFLGIIDWVFIFFGSRKRLGDMLASTIVIKC